MRSFARRKAASRRLADQPKPHEKPRDRKRDRSGDVERCEPELAAFVQQRRIERERRERRVAAEDAGGEKQPPMRAVLSLEREPSGDQTHDGGASDVDEDRRPRKVGSHGAKAEAVQPVTDRGSDAAAEKHDQIAVQDIHRCSPSPFVQGNKKAALRRLADRVPPPVCAVGVISLRCLMKAVVGGTPSPSPRKLLEAL